MKLKLTFKLTESPQLIPLNNRYATSSWIYKVLRESEDSFADCLDLLGYKEGFAPRFKLFTFSGFQIPRGFWRIEEDRIEVSSEQISLFVCFHLPEIMDDFIERIFVKQHVTIGDVKSRIHMQVKDVEIIDDRVEEAKVYQLRALSPIYLSKHVKGRKHKLHISPDDKEYASLFVKNLLDRYRNSCEMKGVEPEPFESDAVLFRANKKSIRSKCEILKVGTPAETSIRAFTYSFSLRGPKTLIEFGINAGFGATTAQGFGCCEIIQTDKI